jgi:hypothetical protein
MKRNRAGLHVRHRSFRQIEHRVYVHLESQFPFRHQEARACSQNSR